MSTPMQPDSARNKPALARRAAFLYAAALVVLGTMFFLPAGTFDYWQAWLYLAILFGMMLFLGTYLVLYEPELLERRLRTREKEATQQRVVQIGYLLFLIAFLLPGFDRRYGWSAVPAWLVLGTDLVIVAAYALFARVLLANRFASRVVEVEAQQELITTGPYGVVRHPMYVASIAIWTLSPLALGSWWGVVPMLAFFPVMVARIVNEEEVLTRELKGYSDYKAKVRYRLLPGVW